MTDPTMLLDLLQKSYVKLGLHFTAYLATMLSFCYFFFRYLSKRDLAESSLRDQTKRDLDNANLKIVDLMSVHSKDNDTRRQAFTDMLNLQLNTAKDMMENISKQNLEAHKLMAERIGTIEGKLSNFETKMDNLSVNIRDLSGSIKVKKD